MGTENVQTHTLVHTNKVECVNEMQYSAALQVKVGHSFAIYRDSSGQ